MNIPLVFLLFILLRACFFLFSNYKISNFLKEYAFKLFLLAMIMEGNLESFSYFFIFDCINLQQSSTFQRNINLLTILFFFFFFSYIVVWYLIIKIAEGKDAKYFFVNYHLNLESFAHVSFESNLMNFCLAASHLIMENHCTKQLIAIACI